MSNAPKLGGRVQINVACPFEMRSDPVWEDAIVMEVQETYFVAQMLRSESTIKRFHAHVGQDWRNYEPRIRDE